METSKEILDWYLNKLQEDLAFAAPEIWMLHIKRRFEEFADELEVFLTADSLE